MCDKKLLTRRAILFYSPVLPIKEQNDIFAEVLRGVVEWFIAPVSKTGDPSRGSGVRTSAQECAVAVTRGGAAWMRVRVIPPPLHRTTTGLARSEGPTRKKI